MRLTRHLFNSNYLLIFLMAILLYGAFDQYRLENSTPATCDTIKEFKASEEITNGIHVSLLNEQRKDDQMKQASFHRPIPQFAIITCLGNSTKSKNWRDYMKQLKVLFKSIALMSLGKVEINLVAPEGPNYDEIIQIPSTWPEEYREKIIFSPIRPIYYPPGFENITTLGWVVCSTGKLFLAEVFPEKDAIIALDVDTFFMQPPDYLWQQFNHFESRQVVGMSPCLNHYDREFNRYPVFGYSGLNGGLIMMNLTRIRNFPDGWHEAIISSLTKYRHLFKLEEQDILVNLFSGGRQSYVYELGCEWNYRPVLCKRGRNRCSSAAVRGVALFHGCMKAFLTHFEPSITGIFQVWSEYEMGSPVKLLLSRFEEAASIIYSRGCSKLSNIKDIYLKAFKTHFEL